MNPARQSLLSAAREEYLACAAICKERRQELRKAERRRIEARTRLEHLRDQRDHNPARGVR